MAIVMRSLKSILANPPDVNWDKLRAMTDEDIRRHEAAVGASHFALDQAIRVRCPERNDEDGAPCP